MRQDDSGRTPDHVVQRNQSSVPRGCEMYEPTGSFYLDTPRTQPSRKAKKRSPRVVAGSFLAVIGIASMLLAAVLAGLHFLVVDSSPTIAAVDSAFVSPAARAELHRELSSSIVDRMVGPEVGAAAAIYGIDVTQEADLVVDKIIDDPNFRSAFDTFVVQAHDQMLVDSAGPAANMSPVTDAALEVIHSASPRLSVLISPNSEILMFDTSSLPDLTTQVSLADRLLVYALLGMIAIPLAALVHPRRHRVLAWVGRAWLITGLASAAGTVVMPYLVGRLTGWSTVEIAIRAALIRYLVPASAVALVGLTAMTAAALWRHWEITRTSREGATAALGAGLVPGSAPAHGLLDLASRGLVDAGRPLTNI